MWYAQIHTVLNVEIDFLTIHLTNWLINIQSKYFCDFEGLFDYYVSTVDEAPHPPWNIWSLVTYLCTSLLLSVPPYWPATTQHVLL